MPQIQLPHAFPCGCEYVRMTKRGAFISKSLIASESINDRRCACGKLWRVTWEEVKDDKKR